MLENPVGVFLVHVGEFCACWKIVHVGEAENHKKGKFDFPLLQHAQFSNMTFSNMT